MTDHERGEYQVWRGTRAQLKAATMAFAGAVGNREPERMLLARAHDVAKLQAQESKQYLALRRKLPWARLVGLTTWPTPLASALGDL